MKGVTVEDVKAQFGNYLAKCASDGPVVITRRGKPIALLLAPLDEDDLERLVLSHSPQFQAIIAKSRKSLLAGKGVQHDEFWAAVKERAHPKSKRQSAKREKREKDQRMK
jgi:prevent-host-death family protein